MVFDVKMEDFRRKAWLVAGGHVTKAPATITYASIVTRESIWLALMITALNNLQVKTGDDLNAYITAQVTEHVWTTLGPEWGPDTGKCDLIICTLYGLKSASTTFCAHLAECMHNLGYTSYKSDPDIWYKSSIRPDDNFHYYL